MITATGAHDGLSDASYEAVATLIEMQIGIKLADGKRTMVEGRLRKRMRMLGLSCLDTYVAHALNPRQAGDELVHLIDSVTTNKTDFFREPAHFAFLQNEAIPALIAAQARRPARIKIWSAACSIGAEAYTVAMVLESMRERNLDFDYSILGTDISTIVLKDAQAAIYSSAMIEPVPPPMRGRYVMVSRDPARTDVRIVPELRRKTRFERLNLLDPSYPVDTDVDIIFCRNVLIYFDQPKQKAVVTQLAMHLRPGGYLLLGHSESIAGNAIPGLRLVQPTVFQAMGRR